MSDQRSTFPRATTAATVAGYLHAPLVGPDGPVVRFSPFPPADEGGICFLQGPVPDAAPRATAFAVVIATADAVGALKAAGYSVVVSPYPKYDYSRAVTDLCMMSRPEGIHPTAVIDGDVILGEGVSIGACAVLSGRIRVGPGATIGPHVRLLSDVRLGSHSVVRSGSAIGGDAFNVGIGPAGAMARLPSFGGVDIGDHVEIGHNVVISRAVDGDTIVAHGVHINDMAMIGNAAVIAEHASIMANCMIGGRSRIGQGCMIGMAATIHESVSIGAGSKVGMGAVVLHDVPAGVVVVGVPARFLRNI